MSLRPITRSVASVEKKMEEVAAMIDGVWSDDPSKQLESITKLNKILQFKNPHTDNVIQFGVVARFVEFLKKEDRPELQAASVLANISYENTKVVIDHGAVPIFVHLLAEATDDHGVREMAAWALANVAADSARCRDYVLQCGALTPLLANLRVNTELSMLRTATWTLSNLCSGEPPPRFGQVKPALSALEPVLHIDDDEFLTNSCKALKYMCDGSEEKIQSVIEAGLVPRLVELLRHHSQSVLARALCTIGNIVAGDIQQTQCVIDNGALPILADLLTQDYKKSIKMNACTTISNITAGSEKQIQSVIDAKLIPILVNLAQNAELDMKKQVVLAISNATSCGSHDQIKSMVEQSCIKPLCDLLVCPDTRTILECLDGLENILKAGEAEKNRGDVNCYCQVIKDAEGVEKIENLQSHDESNEIIKKAIKILETYWLEEKLR